MKIALMIVSALTLAAAPAVHAAPKAAPAKAATSKTAQLDPASSTLTWTGKKLAGSHTGSIRLKDGKIEVKGTEIVGGQFTIDMTSIDNKDLTDATWNKKLVGHLKADDFFAVDKFPVATFTITQIKKLATPTAEANHEVTGNLTLRDQTHPVTFPALIEVKAGSAVAKGTVSIDRTVFGIRYNSGQFFKNLGDKLIDDHFQVALDLNAKL